MSKPMRLIFSVIGSVDGEPARFGRGLWADIWASSPIAQEVGEFDIPAGMVIRVEAWLEPEADHAEQVAAARYGSGETGDYRAVYRPEEGGSR